MNVTAEDVIKGRKTSVFLHLGISVPKNTSVFLYLGISVPKNTRVFLGYPENV